MASPNRRRSTPDIQCALAGSRLRQAARRWRSETSIIYFNLKINNKNKFLCTLLESLEFFIHTIIQLIILIHPISETLIFYIKLTKFLALILIFLMFTFSVPNTTITLTYRTGGLLTFFLASGFLFNSFSYIFFYTPKKNKKPKTTPFTNFLTTLRQEKHSKSIFQENFFYSYINIDEPYIVYPLLFKAPYKKNLSLNQETTYI